MIEVEQIHPSDWKEMSENAHGMCFESDTPLQHEERISFALLASRKGVPLQYVTCREWDSESVYWQLGGSFPGARKTCEASSDRPLKTKPGG